MKAATKKRNTNSMFFHRGSRYASRDRWTLFYLLFSCTLVSLTQVKLNSLAVSSIGNGISFTVQRQPLQRISHREERLGRGSVMAQPLLIFLEHFFKICLRRSLSALSAIERWEPRNQDRSAEKENLSAFFIQVSGGATVAI